VKSRVVILTEIIAPYRIPLFNELARNAEVDLRVIFLAETDPSLRQWDVPKDEIKFSYQVLPSWRRRIGKYNVLLNRGLARALAEARPQVILCGGYNYAASWQAMFWARRKGIPFCLWSESNAQDLRRGTNVVEYLKRRFLKKCNGFAVPGRSAREYLRLQDVEDEEIFTAPNAVDNDFFAGAATEARENAEKGRGERNLPARYFLFAGRLVEQKGVFELLSAYAKLDATIQQQVGLVFVGDGEAREQLERQAAANARGEIRFTGFVQRDDLAMFYALAEALILPTHTDTWGLVVNEAMACALPVIVSTAAGCAVDLLRENWNGLLVPPKDVPALTVALQTIACMPEIRANMSANSAEHIRRYSPEEWSAGIVEMMKSVGEKRG